MTRAALENGLKAHFFFFAKNSLASRWASAICGEVIVSTTLSLAWAAPFSPFAEARLNHMCART